MNHPGREEWMSYLYGELPRASKAKLAAHLNHCRQCEAELAQWRATLSDLNEWKLPDSVAARHSSASARAYALLLRPAVKWAAAAVLVMGIGFGLGRISLASGSVESLRAVLQAELDRKVELARAELSSELRQQQTEALEDVLEASNSAKVETDRVLTELARSIDEKRVFDNESIAAALQQLDSKWATLHASLRKELETVALLTENGFNDTQQKLLQLASFTQPGSK